MPVLSAGSMSGLNNSAATQACLKPVDVQVQQAEGSKKQVVVLVTRKAGAKCNRVKGCVVKTGLKKCAKKGEAQIASLLSRAGYRRDMISLAQQKYRKVLQSFKKPRVTKMTARKQLRAAAAGGDVEEIN